MVLATLNSMIFLFIPSFLLSLNRFNWHRLIGAAIITLGTVCVLLCLCLLELFALLPFSLSWILLHLVSGQCCMVTCSVWADTSRLFWQSNSQSGPICLICALCCVSLGPAPNSPAQTHQQTHSLINDVLPVSSELVVLPPIFSPFLFLLFYFPGWWWWLPCSLFNRNGLTCATG